MNIVEKHITDIRPYEKNPRKNDDAVKYVAASIKQFGWKVPIVIDKDGVIVAGHTRYKAACNEQKYTDFQAIISKRIIGGVFHD